MRWRNFIALIGGAAAWPFVARAHQGERARRICSRPYMLVAAAAALFFYLVHFRAGTFIWHFSQQEGGVWLDEAYRVLHGELIYRDFFELLTPGIVYVDAAFLWLLGPTPTTVGTMFVVIGVIGALAVYAVSITILSSYWRLVPAAIFIGLTYPSYSPGNHKWPTLILCLVGILAVVARRSPLRCAMSGIAFGGALLCTQDIGAGGAAGMFVALWLLRKDGARPMLFAMTSALTVFATMAGFAAAAGLKTVLYDVVGFALAQYRQYGVGVVNIRNLPLWLTMLGLGGLGLAYALVGLARRFWLSDPQPVVIVALVGTGMLLIGGAAHPIDADQLGPKAAPLMIVGTYALQQAVQTRVFRPWPLAGLTLLGAGLTARAVSHLIDVQITRPYVLEQHRAGKIWVFGPPSYLVDLAWLEANTVEGERVFLIPDKGGFNLLSRTRNATSYSSLLDGGFSTNAQVLDVTQQIARTCPAVGIWHRSRLNSFYDPRPEVATMLPLERVIFRDYEVVTEFSNGAVVMRRKPQGCSR